MKEALPVKVEAVKEEKEQVSNANTKKEEETPKPEEKPNISSKNFNLKILEPHIQAENTYSYKGIVYDVSPKEKAVLEKQRDKLTEQQFEQLIKDFDLKPVKK